MYEGNATKNQRPTPRPRTPEQIMVGPLVRVSPEEAAARRLHREQEARRKSAAYVTHVYRSRANGGQAEDLEDEEEIEIAVDGGGYSAEPDVGILSGGWTAEGAVRVDNGEPIQLTDAERARIEEEMVDDDGYDGPDTWEEARGLR